jgi:hypothetical protein
MLSSLGSGALRGGKGSRRRTCVLRAVIPDHVGKAALGGTGRAKLDTLLLGEISGASLRRTAEGGCPTWFGDALTLAGPRPSIQAGS